MAMALTAILLVSLVLSAAPLSQVACQDTADTTLSFTRSLYSVNENNGPAQPVLVLSQPVDCCSTISVWVNIEEGTAKEGEDFTATSPVQVLFPGGITRVEFSVLMVDDVELEGSEKFIVSIDPLSLPYGVVLGDHPTAEVVIIDNGETTVSFESTRYDVNEGDGSVELTISLSEPVPFNASLELHNTDDTTTTTTGRCDYKDGPYNVTIPFNVTTFKYSLPILNDDVYEIDEKLRVEIVSSDHSQIKIGRDHRADVTIRDDEQPISVSFSQTTFTVNERDGNVKANLTLSRPTPCCLHLYVEVEDITANRAIDYGEFDTTQYIVTFPNGTSCSSFDIPIRDDRESEEDETLRITIMDMSLPFGTTLGDNITAEVVIEDNDNYISFSNSDYKQNEDVYDKLCVELTFDKHALFSTTVEVSDDSDTASRGVDYEGGPYHVNINKGDMSAELCFNITSDNDLEEHETFTLRINAGSLHHEIIPMTPDQATITILDDEYIFCFIKRFYTVYEGDGFVPVTLNFSRPLPYDSNVRFRYNDTVSNRNHTTSTEIDYYTAYAWPNFDRVERGTVNYTLNITIVNDNRLEDNGLFSIIAVPGTLPNGHTPCVADVVILDDDDFRLEFESRSYSVSSKNRPDTPVLRLHYPEVYNSTLMFPINVTVHEINGSAYGGVDYVPQLYFHSFEDNDVVYRLIISPIDDNIVEPDETYDLTFTFVAKHSRVRLGENHTTTITIYDDDVCFVSIIEVNGKETLDFSKQLATYVEVNITYDGNQHDVTTFTAEETRTKNRTPLPISPTERINRIDVHVPREFESKIGNVRPGRAHKEEYDFIYVEFDL